jgi:homoserine dehydrogenase
MDAKVRLDSFFNSAKLLENTLLMSDSLSSPLRLGLLGCGTVGGSFVKALQQRAADWKRLGLPECRVEKIMVRSLQKERNLPVDKSVYTTDSDLVVGSGDIDVVVALMGGMQPESGLIRRALQAGQYVITANKAIIAVRGADLEQTALDNNVALLYEAAVAGGLPALRNLKSHFLPNGVTRIEAILNGTCNFMLGEMKAGKSYDDALKKAQELGFAEADPTMDVSGQDAAQKLAILATMAFGQRSSDNHVHNRGIEQLGAADLDYAQANGMQLILLAQGMPSRSSGCTLSVVPTFVAADSGMARAEGPNNIMMLETEGGGPFESMALGAGGAPTAASVMADLASLATGAWKGEFPGILAKAGENALGDAPDEAALPYVQYRHSWYIRTDDAESASHLRAALESDEVKIGENGAGVLEVQNISLSDLKQAMGDQFASATVVQYHPSLTPKLI